MILRHRPETIGLTLDEHGWTNAKEMLAGINRTQFIDMEMLEEIVRTDEKRRYSFNEDKTLIRANQGHSIPVGVELEDAVPPDILWQGTGMKYVESIDREGLLPKSGLYVHLNSDYDTAIKVGFRHGEPAVYKVLTRQIEEESYVFKLSANGVWLMKEVPVKYLERTENLHKG